MAAIGGNAQTDGNRKYTAYTGSADLSVSNRDTYNATGVYRGDYDTAFVKQNENRTAIAVKYWPVWPKMNGAAEQNDADTIAIVWRVAGLVLALVMLVLAVKPSILLRI